jgi:transposase
MLPPRPGARGQTARRAALPCARLRRAGDLPPVDGPPGAEAASRDLGRARAEALRDLQAATLRLTALWRRHDIRSTGPAPGPPAPLRWRSEGVCPPPAQHSVFPDDGRAVTEHPERLQRLAQARNAPVTTWRFPPGGAALQALRGVPCPVAVPTGAALDALTRFDTPSQRMDYLGLPPAAASRGPRRRQGAMTKAGPRHARRALVEGAWASRSPATVRRPCPLRRDNPPTGIQDSSWQAPGRLGKRYRHLRARGTHGPQVGVAMARELVGCMGAIAQEVSGTPSVPKTPGDSTRQAAGDP